ncbi:hypothetical protein [Shewanella sp. GXUN23E]|uniref:hypothetical protein n=1 Tax=Shewanella sp. GXUN23E TaxID=3422498 RepID=UPI003D7EE20B
MKRITLVCLALIGVALLGGCASTKNENLKTFDTNLANKYPPLAVFWGRPSASLQQECQAFAASSVMKMCNENLVDVNLFYRSFMASQVFEKVTLGDETSDYNLAISTVHFSDEDAGDIAKGALAGATLLLVPVDMKQHTKAEVTVYWRDWPLKVYHYELPFVHTMQLFTDPMQGQKDYAEALVSHVIADMQQDDIFSHRFMVDNFHTSDYEKELVYPEQLAGFEYAEHMIYNDPFLGAAVRYVEPELRNEVLDVFVYPARFVDLVDVPEVLAKEARNVQREIEYVAKQNKWQALELEEIVPINAGGLAGVYFDGSYTVDLDLPEYTSTFLFLKEDKFIKIRANFPGKHVKEQVLASLAQFTAPKESDFMKEVRLKSSQRGMQE